MVSLKIEVFFVDSMYVEFNSAAEFSYKIIEEVKYFDSGLNVKSTNHDSGNIGQKISDGSLKNTLKIELTSDVYEQSDFNEIVDMMVDHIKVKFNVGVLY